MVYNPNPSDSCKIEAITINDYRKQLPAVADKIIASCDDSTCYTHINYEQIPSRASVIEIIERFRQILFPGYFNRERLDPVNMRYAIGQASADLFDKLGEQISHAIRHDCFRYNQPCSECEENGHLIALEILKAVPSIRKILATDVTATFDGDPAARSHDEIIFSYPGILAITIYRVAHLLYKQKIPLLPRIMTEYAHGITGIDIHPGAEIGERFVIDHGTGVVIGETTVIGRNVRIYQGVTLGALSLPTHAGERLKDKKRHPTIEDDVIIYSGATILGGDTIIGSHSVVGGNVWLTHSVDPETSVMLASPKLVYK